MVEKPKMYRVLNPLGVPENVPIMHFKGKDYFEGEEFTPPQDMTMDRILRGGFVEEVEA